MFLELRGSEESLALTHVFMAERASIKVPKSPEKSIPSINSVAVIGGGTMGLGIVAALRGAGLPVMLVERDQASVSTSIKKLGAQYDRAVVREKLSQENVNDLINGVTGTDDYGQLTNVDLVIEAVFEDLDIKRDVFARLGKVCRHDTILATNTSYLDPQMIAQSVPHPERFIGLHFFSPANIMKLLEVIPTDKTDSAVISCAIQLAKRLNKIPVNAGICEGFIGNRILKRYRSAAEALVKSGVAIAEIDQAMRDFGMAMGPFEKQDLGGLDIAWFQREHARAAGQIIPETLGDRLVNAGRKGQKTSGGWYDYAEGSRQPLPSATVSQLIGEVIADKRELDRLTIAGRLVAEMAKEGAIILSEGIAQRAADIDLVKIHGYGFPRWLGGPMFYISQCDEQEIKRLLDRQPADALRRFF